MTYHTNAATGAGVLDTGTNNWIPALDGHAARHQPSIPNWRQVASQ